MSEELNVKEFLEKEVNKTKFGKFMKGILIIILTIFIIGLILSLLQFVLYVRKIDSNIYQTIVDIRNIIFKCSFKSMFFWSLFYSILLPQLIKYKKKDTCKKNDIASIVVITVFILCILGPIFKLIYEMCLIIE